MTYYDEKLLSLQSCISRSRQLTAMIQELRRQRDKLSARVRELETVLLQEEADVDRLEGRSLAAFFFNVIGKMDEQMNKERGEAYSARVKYDTALHELEAVEYELGTYEEELASLRGCTKEYEAVLQEKEAAVQSAGGPVAEEILKLESRNAELQAQKKELREAVNAGDAAFITTKSILEQLESAEGWTTWYILGGGLVEETVKYNDLDDAQASIEKLQSQLRRFKTELADVAISAEIGTGIDSFLGFADSFFDDLFADWAVREQISRAKAQIEHTKHQLETILFRLDAMFEDCSLEQTEIHSKLDTLIRNAEL